MSILNDMIFKKYIGQFNDLNNLNIWFIKFHYTVSILFTDIQNISNVEKLIIDLDINLGNSTIHNLAFENVIESLSDIIADYSYQFNRMKLKKCYECEELENDKLILYNIIELYFKTLRSSCGNNSSKRFVKDARRTILRVIPKTKQVEMFENFINIIMGNIIYILAVILLLFTFLVFYSSIIPDIVIFIIHRLSKYFIVFSADFLSTDVINIFVVVLTIIAIIFMTFKTFTFAIKSLRKTKLSNFMENDIMAFPKSISERNLFYTNFSIGISAIALVVAIYSLIYK